MARVEHLRRADIGAGSQFHSCTRTSISGDHKDSISSSWGGETVSVPDRRAESVGYAQCQSSLLLLLIFFR